MPEIGQAALDTASVASAATCDIGATDEILVSITGTTTITSFGTAAKKLRFIVFTGVLTLTHNATSLILPGGANITTAAGDTAWAMSDASGNWRVCDYTRAASKPHRTDGPAFSGTVSMSGTLAMGGSAGTLISVDKTSSGTGFFRWDSAGVFKGAVGMSLGAADGAPGTVSGDMFLRAAANLLLLGGNVVGIKLPSAGTSVEIPLTTASISTTTGALTVAGGVGIAGATNIGGALTNRRAITVDADGRTLTNAESGTLFTNEGATARDDFNLPTAVAGLTYAFHVQDADGIRVIAAAGDTIRIAGSVSAAAGRADSTTIGSFLRLTAINATEWVAETSVGTWSVT